MPNILDGNGLQTKTRDEIVQELVDGLKLIYGNDINVDPDTPDGQLINIFAQSAVDNLDLLRQIYTSFDPEQAIGVILDQRVAINGIKRLGGTYSRTEVVVVTNRALTLYGMDQDVETVYTVEDGEGNQWQLIETEVIAGAGTYTLLFQAVDIGQVLSLPNTIVNPVTIVLGVQSVNNPTVQTVIGVNQETDYGLRNRRRQSIAINAVGYRESLIAALRNIPGIVEALVYENVTGITDADGIPSHSIWVIVEGSYDAIDIATAIYQQRNAGAGMKGDIEFEFIQPDGTPFLIKWDDVEVYQPFIKMDVQSINPNRPVDYALIIQQIPQLYVPSIYETLNTGRLNSVVNEIDPNCLISNDGFSRDLAGPYTSLLAADSKKERYVFTSSQIILYPILVLPSVKIVDMLGTLQLSALGGYGTYAWSIQGTDLGCTVDASTGLFTAGSTMGTVTVRCTDGEGELTDVTVEVQ